MKNKIFIIKVFICFFFVFFSSKALTEDLVFNAAEIKTSDNENIIRASNGVNIIDPSGLIINGDEIEYNKEKSILNVTGNVVVIDKINKNTLRAEKIIYFRLLNIIKSKSSTLIEVNNKHTIETSNVLYDGGLKKISSKDSTTIKDLNNNKLDVSEFTYSITSKIFSADDAIVLDNESNKYNIEKLRFNLQEDKILGKDISIEFNNKLFNSNDNQPRLKGNAIYLSKESAIIQKGIFTTCKKTGGCPPWQMTAREIRHDKIKKTLNYKNALLKVYQVPVLYFPLFFHPDPTVKRQSGFLKPQFSNSTTGGSYFSLPYYKVIKDNIDLTLTPRIYLDNKTIFQTEYRHLTKNSNHILDFSIKNKDALTLDPQESSSETHFYSDSSFKLNFDYFDQAKIDLRIQQTSNETYLKKYKIDPPALLSGEGVKDESAFPSVLNSKMVFEAINNDGLELEIKTVVYEDLSKKKSDRFNYVLPSYEFSNYIYRDVFDDNLIFSSNGYNNLYDTNINEKVVINNFNYRSDSIVNSSGFVSNYAILFKNFNSDSIRSATHKSKKHNDIQSLLNYRVKYPLKKNGDRFDRIFSPIFSARYSPNKNKNLTNKDLLLEYNELYSLNRISSPISLEGGQSFTIGNEYSIYDKNNNNNELFAFNLATMFRDEKDKKLPTSSTLGKKTSDIIGEVKLKTNKFVEFSYDFSLDNDLETINYNLIDTTFSINNFVTTFEFLEQNNALGSKSYLSNETTLNLNSNNSFSFKTRQNKEKDLTEYYNLIYEYKNDCLIAAIEYQKNYYQDVNITPEQNLFFTITIMPFVSINTPKGGK